MIAVTVFTFVLAAIYSTWTMIVRASRVGQEAAAQAQRQRVAVHTIEESLVSIQSFQASLAYYAFNVTNGDSPVLSFTARLPEDFPRSGRYGDFTVRRLTFAVEDVNDPIKHGTEKDLVLRQYPILTGVDTDEEQNPYVLARNVQLFSIECWDTNAVDWATGWDNTNSIPPVIRVSLAFGGKKDNSPNGGPVFSVTRDIAVPSQMMPIAVQAPGRSLVNPPPPLP